MPSEEIIHKLFKLSLFEMMAAVAITAIICAILRIFGFGWSLLAAGGLFIAWSIIKGVLTRQGSLVPLFKFTVSGILILVVNWTWARLTVSAFQRRAGALQIGDGIMGSYYEMWGVVIPFS